MTGMLRNAKGDAQPASEPPLSQLRLAGVRLLVLEDEFLIAMDVEQLCRDHGAEDVVIRQNLAEALKGDADYDAAIVDLMLGGESTVEFAHGLRRNGEGARSSPAASRRPICSGGPASSITR